LPAAIIKKFKDCAERLVRIVGNIAKPPALIVFEKHISCDCNAWQIELQLTDDISIRQTKQEPTKLKDSCIVSQDPGKARANPSE
jgi:hypothetical protein